MQMSVNKISVTSINVNGIKSKYDEIIRIAEQRKPAIIMVQEVHLLNNHFMNPLTEYIAFTNLPNEEEVIIMKEQKTKTNTNTASVATTNNKRKGNNENVKNVRRWSNNICKK